MSVFTLFVCFIAYSQALNMNVAKVYAEQWLKSVGQKSVTDLDCVYTQSNEEKSQDYFYVFSSKTNNTYIILSADERILPVLGYSCESSFDPNNIPPNMKGWLDGYVDEMNYIFTLDEIEKHSGWQIIPNENMMNKEITEVEPLLGNLFWNQNSPYNYYCPADPAGPGGKCYAGCVATAMAMIMKYWNFPPHGFGQSGYYSSYGYLSVNYQNETYLWDEMPLQATSSNYDAIAKLMYHCGVSVEMDYGPNGSGAVTAYVADALKTYFGYKEQCTYEWKDYYSNSTWENMMKTELNQGRPMQYRGGGHSFVLDGYNNNNLFHFNWGWSGSYNGYFTFSNLNPGSYNFNDDQYAVMYIEPDKATQTAPDPPTLANSTETCITLNPVQGCEYNINGGEWQTSSVFEELTSNTSYIFTQRKAETGTHLPSPASLEAQFTTPLSINENILENIKIYPNPTTGELRVTNSDIRLSDIRLSDIEIFDIYGRKQKAESRISEIGQSEIVINISDLASGVYFVKIFTESGEVIKKVFKE